MSAHHRGDIHNLILTGHGIAVAGLLICPTFAPRSHASPTKQGNVFILVQFYLRTEQKGGHFRNCPRSSILCGFRPFLSACLLGVLFSGFRLFCPSFAPPAPPNPVPVLFMFWKRRSTPTAQNLPGCLQGVNWTTGPKASVVRSY